MSSVTPSDAVDSVTQIENRLNEIEGKNTEEEFNDELSEVNDEQATQESEAEEDSDEQEEESVLDEEDGESTEFETLDEIAEALGLENKDDFLEKYKIETIVDGEKSEVTLKDLWRGYQTNQHNTKTSMKLADERRAFEATAKEHQEVIDNNIRQTAYFLQSAEGQLLSEYNSVNWDVLKSSDPSRYAALKIDFDERKSAIDKNKNDLLELHSSHLSKLEHDKQEALKERLSKEHEKVLSVIPDWHDDDVRQKESAQISELLKGYGFSDAEIYGDTDDQGNIRSEGISDHRIIKLLRDLAQASKAPDRQEIAKKKAKLAKPFSRSAAKNPNRSNAAKRREENKALKDGRVNSQDIILKRLNNMRQ